MLLKPVITEKSMTLAQTGQFTFGFSGGMSKTQIKTGIENLFKVKVVKVRTSRQNKAIVVLQPGQTIEYFELPKEKKKKL
ncbi:MAG: 50S ribosomal protein L23 [Candidatus Beckwithbacteria bacterium GW2011_GWA2_43_10]|uniref:50S ribosomal protein L23 n=1 Tax=Candidatus Beckwithbacteria bacterium GW2011_GWA2_43_10 TaxID=1618369 RepID=A0A0G1C5B7_9BACT|nr:MAG: 50S ribosomal protein L23 [Candidatus Beckwithbacteria bacterium GW2011_GWA2_43_10]